MSRPSSPTVVTVPSSNSYGAYSPPSHNREQQPAATSSMSRRNSITAFSCLSSGGAYSSANSSTMSAATAAALLLQAATGASVNGDITSNSSLPVRRASTGFFDSPQRSPSFPAVISAAAQQAVIAAAQAIGSSHSSPITRPHSNLQAAVISLALAANPAHLNQSNTSRSDQRSHGLEHSQAVTDLFLLSERNPELLSAHPSLASVFRRRSSTMLPSYLSDLSASDHANETESKPLLGADANVPQHLASALEAMHSQYAVLSDLSGYAHSPTETSRSCAFPSEGEYGCKRSFTGYTDSQRFTSVCINSSSPSEKYTTTDPATSKARFLNSIGSLFPNEHSSYPQGYKDSSCSDTSAAQLTAVQNRLSAYARGLNTSGDLGSGNTTNNSNSSHCISPTLRTNMNDMNSGLCQSSSPLSCSSLSNTSNTPQLNASPMHLDNRSRGGHGVDSIHDYLGNKTGATASGAYTSMQAGSLSETDIKSEFTPNSGYHEQPTPKREQRLMKNREAARECRRKKKEYVKCLESRVSLLESQNQQLIEELQKVKALCFNELCGLGLNSSTAACAAAVLAAVTSATPTATSSMKTTAPSNMLPGHTVGLSIADLAAGAHLTTATRSRARRRSIISDTSKLTVDTSNDKDSKSASYSGSYLDKLGNCGGQSSTGSYSTSDIGMHKRHGPVTCSNNSPSLTTNDCLRESPTGYNSPSVSRGQYQSQGHVSTSHTISSMSRTDNRGQDISEPYRNRLYSALQTSESSSSSTQPTSNYFLHPHYATKRAYRGFGDERLDYLDHRPVNSDMHNHASIGNEDAMPNKSARTSNSVADAAAILAAAAAIVAESESDQRTAVCRV